MTLASAVALGFALFGACKTPTSVTFALRTDIDCETTKPPRSLAHVLFGKVGNLESKDSLEQPSSTKECAVTASVGKLDALGTVVALPSDDDSAKIAMIAILGVDRVTASCGIVDGPGDPWRDCIVARRQLSFIDGEALTVDIPLYRGCIGVPCDEDTTCVPGRGCVSSTIEPTECIEDSCGEDDLGGGSSSGAAVSSGSTGDASSSGSSSGETTSTGEGGDGGMSTSDGGGPSSSGGSGGTTSSDGGGSTSSEGGGTTSSDGGGSTSSEGGDTTSSDGGGSTSSEGGGAGGHGSGGDPTVQSSASTTVGGQGGTGSGGDSSSPSASSGGDGGAGGMPATSTVSSSGSTGGGGTGGSFSSTSSGSTGGMGPGGASPSASSSSTGPGTGLGGGTFADG